MNLGEARALLRQAYEAQDEGRYTQALSFARQGVGAARRAGEDLLALRIRAREAFVLLDLERQDAAAATLLEVVAEMEIEPALEPEYTFVELVVSQLSFLAARLPIGLDAIERLLSGGQTLYRRSGGDPSALQFRHAWSHVLGMRRRWSDALPLAESLLRERRNAWDEGLCEPSCYVAALVDALLGTGDPVGARRRLEDAWREHPRDARLPFMLAEIAILEGEYDRALDELDAAAAGGYGKRVLLRQAIAHAHAGDRGLALDALAQWTARVPENAYAALWRATVSGEPGSLSDLAGGSRWRHATFDFARGQLGDVDLVREAERAACRDDARGEAWTWVGMGREGAGDARGAREAYERCLRFAQLTAAESLWARGRLRALART